MSVVRTTALSDHTGVEIHDIARAALDDEALGRALRELIGRHHLLLWREGVLSVDEQLVMMAHFGEIVDEGGDGRRYVYVSNAREDGVLAMGRQLVFHSDNVFTPHPLNITSLYGERIVDEPAPTLFANAVRACALLDDATSARLADAQALNLSGFAGGSYRYRDAEVEAHHPRAVHPVITHDTFAHTPALMVSEQQTDRIVDWPPDASEETLQALFALLYRPDNVYEHRWREGDLVVWDNLALQHGRPPLDQPGERTLRRMATVRSNSADQRAWHPVSHEAEADEVAAARRM
jgi:taurine dioxygenase